MHECDQGCSDAARICDTALRSLLTPNLQDGIESGLVCCGGH